MGVPIFFACISNDVPYDGFTCRIGIIQHLLFYVLLLLLMDNIASNSVSISFVRNSGPLSRLCEKTSDVCMLNLFVSLFFLIITVSLWNILLNYFS